MALEKLFTDRGARKFIRESINNAEDIGKGVCERCGNESYLLKAFNTNLCEDCCQKMLNVAEDYDNVFDSIPTNENATDVIYESYVYPDFNKMNDVCNKSFGGNMEALLQSYGFTVQFDWYDKLSKDGAVFLTNGDMRRGKSHFNKFMNDFDGMFDSSEDLTKIKADPDGTTCSQTVVTSERQSANKSAVFGTKWDGKFHRTQAKNDFMAAHGGSTKIGPNETPAVNTGASSKTAPAQVKTQKPNKSTAGQNAKASIGAEPVKTTKTDLSVADNPSNNGFDIYIGKNSKIECSLVTSKDNIKSYDVKYSLANSVHRVTVDSEGKDNNFIAGKILEDIIKNPGAIFPSFEGSDNGFEIVNYNICKFALDEYSFNKKDLSVCMVYHNKKATKYRVSIYDKDLVNPSSLNAVLTDYIVGKLKDKYPILFDGNNKVKTSVGDAIFVLDRLDEVDNSPIVSVSIDNAGNAPIEVKCEPAEISSSDKTGSLMGIVLKVIDKIIPGINNSPAILKNPKKEGFSDKIAFSITDGSGSSAYDVMAAFSEESLLDSGDFVFLFKVRDKISEIVQPKEDPEKIVYRKAGTPVETFLKQEGSKLYNKYFSKSSMTDVMTASAQSKMKNPTKKQALFNKIADEFVTKNLDVKYLKDLEVTSEIEVNKDGKVTKAFIEVCDPYQDVADDSRKLADMLKLEKEVPYLKFKKAGPRNVRTDNYPTVRYEVDDIEAFSKQLNLRVMENMIFEAFGITLVSESKRKTFYM